MWTSFPSASPTPSPLFGQGLAPTNRSRSGLGSTGTFARFDSHAYLPIPSLRSESPSLRSSHSHVSTPASHWCAADRYTDPLETLAAATHFSRETTTMPPSMFGRASQSYSTPSSPSLASHYIPDKLSVSPAPFDGAESRRQSRIAAGGWGAAARSSHAGSTFSGQSYDQLNGRRQSGQMSSADTQPALLRQRKWGAGRAAWGENGGGHAALGAGGYESDDGVELDQSHDQDTVTPLSETEPHSHVDRPYGTNTKSGRDKLVAGASVPSSRYQEVPEDKSLKSVRGFRSLMGVKGWRSKGRWNKFKWILFGSNTVLTAYAVAGFIAMMLMWANYYSESKVLFVVNQTELILGTIAVCLCLITAVIGWAGILLNNRTFLGVYALLLWVSFAFIVAPGYIAYKKRTFNLSGKMNRLWSQVFNLPERRLVQTELQCCGYYSPYIEAAADGMRCYSRSLLPGCKGPLVEFEKTALRYVYTSAFCVVPFHLICIVVSLLCSNHITYRFGKGVTPSHYRVDDQLLQQSYSKAAYERQFSGVSGAPTDGSLHHQLLYADQLPPPPPRPRFWQESSSSSASSSKSKQ